MVPSTLSKLDPVVVPAADQRAARAQPDLDELYTAHFDFVWRSLRRLGVAEASLDDATQDVFIVVYRRLTDYEPRWSARSWLFAIARRVASDYRRRVRRKGGLAPLHDSIPAPQQNDPFDGAVRGQASRIVGEFLDTLDEDRRAVFILSELEGMNAREIGEALDANQSTVYSRLGSARKALVRFVERNYREALGGGDE